MDCARIGRAAGLLAGTVVGIVAQLRFDDAQSTANQVDADAAKDDADGLATIANVFWIGSGIVAVAGLVWGLIDLTSGGEDEEESRVPAPPQWATNPLLMPPRFGLRVTGNRRGRIDCCLVDEDLDWRLGRIAEVHPEDKRIVPARWNGRQTGHHDEG